jgi:HSP20 family molecular chaperone IbpA
MAESREINSPEAAPNTTVQPAQRTRTGTLTSTRLPSVSRSEPASPFSPLNLWSPPIDVSTRDGQLQVHADLPGMRQEDVHVSIHDGVLSISGERANQHEQNRGGVYRRERSYGSFRRDIPLPEAVDAESIKASFENGVLEVTMPMPLPMEAKPAGRRIPISPKQGGGPDVH